MAYAAKDWVSGELITAEDLDRLEQGLAQESLDREAALDTTAALAAFLEEVV